MHHGQFRAACITLTVDVHPDGLDGRRPEAVLSLAVVAASLGPQDLCDVQRLVEHAGVLEAVRHTPRRLCPSDLGRTKGRNDDASWADFKCNTDLKKLEITGGLKLALLFAKRATSGI